MKNSIKLLLLSLFTPLFIGVSFGAYDIYGGLTSIYQDSYSWSNANSSNTIVANFSANNTYCGLIYGGSSNYAITSVKVKCQSNNTTWNVSNGNVGKGKYFCFTNYMCTSNANLVIETSGAPMSSSYNVSLYSVDLPVSVETNDCSAIETELNECETFNSELQGNFNTCLDRVNTLNGQVGSLSGSLSSCQSDLSDCTNSCDVSVSQCRESLSGCQSDLTNMTNYNDSLNSQLQECLANSPMPDTPCEGTGCDEIISGSNTMFSMFRSVEDMMYSLPLSNNIYLPNGFRGYVDSGVVAIGEIEKKKIVIDDDSFNEINKSYYKVFAGLIFLFLTALFTYYLKKFITKFFIPKTS